MVEYYPENDPCWMCSMSPKTDRTCLACPYFITGYEPLGGYMEAAEGDKK
jgi:hypothetical protein